MLRFILAVLKDGHACVHTHAEIAVKYGGCMMMQAEMPPMNWSRMGRHIYRPAGIL